jgi:hypothetical protein
MDMELLALSSWKQPQTAARKRHSQHVSRPSPLLNTLQYYVSRYGNVPVGNPIMKETSNGGFSTTVETTCLPTVAVAQYYAVLHSYGMVPVGNPVIKATSNGRYPITVTTTCLPPVAVAFYCAVLH